MVIPGFGAFEPRARAARQGRNPQTGQPMSIAASVTPAFSAGALGAPLLPPRCCRPAAVSKVALAWQRCQRGMRAAGRSSRLPLTPILPCFPCSSAGKTFKEKVKNAH